MYLRATPEDTYEDIEAKDEANLWALNNQFRQLQNLIADFMAGTNIGARAANLDELPETLELDEDEQAIYDRLHPPAPKEQ